MKKETVRKENQAEKAKETGKAKSPVVRTARHVIRLLQNKVVASLMLFGQGVLFLASPSGDMTPTIRMSAGMIILVCLMVIFLHMRHREKSGTDIAITVMDGLLIAAAAYFLAVPDTIEPYVRIAAGAVAVITALVNLVETLKIRNRKDWKFIVSLAGVLAVATLGVMMIVARQEDIAVTQRSIGAILILNAVVNIWYIVQLHQKVRKNR